MTTSRLRTRHLLTLACVVGLALAGCGQRSASEADDPAAQPTSSSPDEGPSNPDDSRSSPDRGDGPGGRLMPLEGDSPAVRWTESGFEVLAFGSGSCPPTASAVEVAGNGTVVIDVGWQGDRDTPCTDDYGPSTSFIEAPASALSRREPITVRLRQDGALSAPMDVTYFDATTA